MAKKRVKYYDFYKGKYLSLMDISLLTGLSYGVLRARYINGERGDQLFRPLDREVDNIKVDYRGQKLTFSQLSKAAGVREISLRHRWNAGKRGEDLWNVNKVKPTTLENFEDLEAHIVLVNGKYYSFGELSRITGLTPDYLKNKYLLGIKGVNLFKDELNGKVPAVFNQETKDNYQQTELLDEGNISSNEDEKISESKPDSIQVKPVISEVKEATLTMGNKTFTRRELAAMSVLTEDEIQARYDRGLRGLDLVNKPSKPYSPKVESNLFVKDTINLEPDRAGLEGNLIKSRSKIKRPQDDGLIRVNYGGKFRTLLELAKLTGLNENLIMKGYRGGLRGTDLVRYGEKESKIVSPIRDNLAEYRGEVLNLTELSEVTGIKRSTLADRYCKGMRGSKLTGPVHSGFKDTSNLRTIEYRGKPITFRQLSSLSGIKKSTLRSRYSRGLREEDLVAPLAR